MNKSSSSFNNTVGVKATWKIIDGGKARSLYKYHISKVKEEENTYNLKLARIRKEVEENYYRLDTAKKNIMTTYQAKESAQESLRLSRLRFKAGISKNREVINQQRDHNQAELNHIQSISNYNIHLSELKRLTGINKVKKCLSKQNGFSNIDQKHASIDINQLNIFKICN